MDIKLTTTHKEPSDRRTACSENHAGSTTPTRARESDHQGAQFEKKQIGSGRPTTVVAPRTGGASSSKWTRKTLPWNASLRTTVVAFISIGETDQRQIAFMPKLSDSTFGINDVLRPHGRRR